VTAGDQPAGLDEVAAELYGLPAAEFTAARNARAKELQAGGDKPLAAAVRRLGRPSAAAALANQLVRRDPDALQPVLDLGVALRRASAALDGPAMRTLSRQQRDVVAPVLRQARSLASGSPVSEQTLRELEETLRAAIADAGAAEQLMAGRLTGPLEHTGFGPAPGAHLTVVPGGGRGGEAPVAGPAKRPADSGRAGPKEQEKDKEKGRDSAAEERAARDRTRAEEAVAAAETALEDAVAERKQAAQRVADVDGSMAELRSRVEQLRAELESARGDQARAERDQSKAKAALDKATHAMRAAARRLEDASTRLEQLD
jgi:hypothetical protein